MYPSDVFTLHSFNTPFHFQMAVAEDHNRYHMERRRRDPRSFVMPQTISVGTSHPLPHSQIPRAVHFTQNAGAPLLLHKEHAEMRTPPPHSTDSVASSNAQNLFVAFQVPCFVVATETGMLSNVTTLIFYSQTFLVVP